MLDRRALLAAGIGLSAAPMAAMAARPRDPFAGANDPLGVRADFATTQSDAIYLNSAFHSMIPKQVVAAGLDTLQRKTVAPVLADDLTGPTRAAFARLVNATPDEIALLHSTGEGQNVVVRALGLKRGDNVLVSQLNYDTDYILYRQLQADLGVEFRLVPHRGGVVEAQDFERLIDKRTRLLSVAWVSHQNGYVHDLKSIAALAHAHGAYLYADVIQGLGTIKLDVKDSGVDFLCAGSHKWMLSVAGCAPLYIRKDLIGRMQCDRFGEGQISRRLPQRQYEFYDTARKFEVTVGRSDAVTELAAGLAYIDTVGLGRIETHTVGLGLRLQQGLRAQGKAMFTPEGNRSPIVVFYAKTPAPEILAHFAKGKIVLTARDGTVRISPALFNTEAEIDQCLELCKSVV
jgi:cysteine desulfurase/selenocysteine lyase